MYTHIHIYQHYVEDLQVNEVISLQIIAIEI